MVHSLLHILRQGTGHTSDIHFICIFTFRLNKHLMPFFICKTYYLILNRRTVSGSCSVDHSGVKRRSIQIIPNDLMCLFIGVGEPAGFLRDLYIFRISRKGKRHYFFVSELFFHLAVINGISCDSGRCTGLKTEHFNSQLLQGIGKIIGCLKTVRPCIIAYIPINTSCLQISSCAENHCFTMINSA